LSRTASVTASTRGWSNALRSNPEARAARKQINLALRRLVNVLDEHLICGIRTLEAKISEAGPPDQRIDPHLLGIALKDLADRGRVLHRAEPSTSWYAYPRRSTTPVEEKLREIARVHAETGRHAADIGDALEATICAALQNVGAAFRGRVREIPDERRFEKTPPPQTLLGHTTTRLPDFIVFDDNAGPINIECKNTREWIYLESEELKQVIITAYELHTTPLFASRKIHYTASTNLMEPAGILIHESYNQYYPTYLQAVAEQARHVDNLGYSDILIGTTPTPRTQKFFSTLLPRPAQEAQRKFERHRDALYEFAKEQLPRDELYRAIGSPRPRPR
jgi:hypothetical protein